MLSGMVMSFAPRPAASSTKAVTVSRFFCTSSCESSCRTATVNLFIAIYLPFLLKIFYAFFRPKISSPPIKKNRSSTTVTIVVMVGAVKIISEPTTM